MGDYSSDRRLQVMHFERWLKLMDRRAHDEAHGPCFIIFQERASGDLDDDSDANATEELISWWAQELDGPQRSAGNLGALSDEPSDRAADLNRWIQFSIERDWFCMDMAQETLLPQEAARIMRDRSGFFYLRDLPQWTLHGEDVEGHDPFRKIYMYGDERSAAEDMAYIFFDLWKFPPDWDFRVSASAFGDGPTWESDVSVRHRPPAPRRRQPRRRK